MQTPAIANANPGLDERAQYEPRGDALASAVAAFATSEQIGEATAFLCSEGAAQITGTTISVDGGWTAL